MADRKPTRRTEELVSVHSPLPQRMKDSLAQQTPRHRLLTSVAMPVNAVQQGSVSGMGEGSSLEGVESGGASQSSVLRRRRRRRVGAEEERETQTTEEVQSYLRSVSASVVENRKRVDWLEEGLDQQKTEAKRAKNTMRALSADLEKAKASHSSNSKLIGQLAQENKQLAADMKEMKDYQKKMLEVLTTPSSSLPAPPTSGHSSSLPTPPTSSPKCSSSSENRPQWFDRVDPTMLTEVSTQKILGFLPKMAGSWDRIGVGLGLGDKVKCIRHDPGEAESKLLVVMETWIEKGNAVTWKQLLDVLWDIELHTVARKVEETLCRDNA